MITAHSGCDHTADNSLAFIQYALSLPIDAFEIDIRKNSCGELILSHDETEETAVLLATAFQLLKDHPEKKINCDLKQKHIEAEVFALAKQYHVEHQLIFTGDVNPELFKKGTVQFPEVIWFSNIETFLPDYEGWQASGVTEAEKTARLEKLLLLMLDYETAGLNWHYKNAEKVLEQARRLGIGISVWTVNDEKDQEFWLKQNAENITSRNIKNLLKQQ